ncbi:MAG TPA: malto-oligosyltrehalose trehalohydrolase [Methylophilaceae bacterium]|jgi:maltooligosyltrehalose trehalohydrolase
MPNNDYGFIRQLSGGAHLIKPGRVRFRLWAPQANKVEVVLADGKAYALKTEGQTGWFSTQIACEAGTQYQYRIVNQQGIAQTVPDPYSRAQQRSVHGYSVVVDPHAYQWQMPDWKGRPWHESVFYEMHLGLCGGFNGAVAKLDALAAAGFTCIELMPIASFPGERNWGYDGVLPYAPQYTYGSPAELKALIDAAHALNLSVFLDVVYNHMGPDGNYLNHYASSFFTDKQHTPWGNAIDFENPEVRSFYTENVLYWLDEYRFDGLRFDACHAILDKSWLVEVAAKVHEELKGERHIHLVLENDDNAADLLQGSFNAQWNDDGHHALHVLLTGETTDYYSNFAEQPAQKLARCMTQGFIYPGGARNHDPVQQTENIEEEVKNTPPTSFVLYLQNHDQIGNRPFGERLTTLTPDSALKVASALVLLSPQIPLLFMGEEFGAVQPFLYFTSHEDPALIKSIREGRRAEFSKFDEFAESDFALEIPDPNDINTFLASIPQLSDIVEIGGDAALGWDKWVSHLLRIRHTYIIPRLSGASAISAEAVGPSAVKARWLLNDGTVLAIAVNLGTERLTLKLEDFIKSLQATLLFEHNEALCSVQKGVLPGHSFVAFLESSV